MQIEHLRCFIALSQTQSITKTSYAFHTTPQNISRILRKLESEMNVPLFERHPNGITLTSFGEHFLKFAKSTLYQFDEMHADFQFKISKNTTNQQITFYSNNAINETILNDILTAFSKAYPSISVNNIIVDWKEGYQKINDNPQALAFLYTINDDDYLKTAQKKPHRNPRLPASHHCHGEQKSSTGQQTEMYKKTAQRLSPAHFHKNRSHQYRSFSYFATGSVRPNPLHRLLRKLKCLLSDGLKRGLRFPWHLRNLSASGRSRSGKSHSRPHRRRTHLYLCINKISRPAAGLTSATSLFVYYQLPSQKRLGAKRLYQRL